MHRSVATETSKALTQDNLWYGGHPHRGWKHGPIT